MLLQIEGVLTPAEAQAAIATLADPSVWRDGAESAGGRAKAAKNNLQGDISSPADRGVIEKISRSVLGNETIRAAAQPDSVARVQVNKYDPDMSYGSHVDAPYIDGIRTDLSFTLFLSDAANYDGGELVIESSGTQDRVKLDAGSLVLYPAGSVHRVDPVTRGSRIAAIGWIRSRIRSPIYREMLFELEMSLAELAKIKAPSDLQIRLNNLRNNLLRSFGD